MNTDRGIEVQFHIFLILELDGCFARFLPGSHLIRGWVDPTASLEDVEKRKISCSFREPNHDSSAVQLVA
jgi:hypothetical protein